MKKWYVLLGGAMLAFALAGCNASQSVSDLVQSELAVTDNTDYAQYENLKNEGKLDLDGFYIGETYQADPDHGGKVHVTFGENRYLQMNYYLDAELTQPIEGTSVDVERGTTIYCSQPTLSSSAGAGYRYVNHLVYAFDEDNHTRLLWESRGESMIYRISEDFLGKEIALYPVGEFQTKTVKIKAVYYDEKGNEIPYYGTWTINGDEYGETSFEAEASEKYTLSFAYENKYYYVAKTEPEAFSVTANSVQFVTNTGLELEQTYKIYLKKYTDIRVSVSNEAKDRYTIALDGVEKDGFEAGFEGLKAGQTVQITCDKKYSLFLGMERINEAELLVGGLKRYTITVPNSFTTDYVYFVTEAVKEITLDGSSGSKYTYKVNGTPTEPGTYLLKNEDVVTIMDSDVVIIPEWFGKKTANVKNYQSGDTISWSNAK